MIDLWPENIAQGKLRPPVAVLHEQAALLGQKTQNVVQAKVRRVEGQESVGFGYTFNIVAVGLGAYTYRLFTIYHRYGLYPVRFFLDEGIATELLGPSSETERSTDVGSEEALIELLGKVLKAKKTVQIINALLSQADYIGEPIPF